MKIRTNFVTNSSSSNFIIFGRSKKRIIDIIRAEHVFGELTDVIISRLADKEVIAGDTLKEFYEDEILASLTIARDDIVERLKQADPGEWVMGTDIGDYISGEAGLIHDIFLERNVALNIELDDEFSKFMLGEVESEESYGWKACGFHYSATDDIMKDRILIIGINKH